MFAKGILLIFKEEQIHYCKNEFSSIIRIVFRSSSCFNKNNPKPSPSMKKSFNVMLANTGWNTYYSKQLLLRENSMPCYRRLKLQHSLEKMLDQMSYIVILKYCFIGIYKYALILIGIFWLCFSCFFWDPPTVYAGC